MVCRLKNVGAPTWIRDIVVHMGTGTIRGAGVANNAGLVGDSREPEKAAERKLTAEGTESTEERGLAGGGASGKGGIRESSEMERLVMPEGALRGSGQGGTPPVFPYVGETKDLQENGLHEGETKGLAGARAKKGRRTRRWGVLKWHKSNVPSA